MGSPFPIVGCSHTGSCLPTATEKILEVCPATRLKTDHSCEGRIELVCHRVKGMEGFTMIALAIILAGLALVETVVHHSQMGSLPRVREHAGQV